MRLPVFVAAAVLAASSVASAATPAPRASAPPARSGGPAAHATAPARVNVESLQPKSLFPKVALHTEMIVEINKLGQVSRVRSIKPSKDVPFNTHAYGNALQAFIRTPDGNVVLGSYRLSYDYDPKTQRIRRQVALVSRGGVDPERKGAAAEMMDIAKNNRDKTPPPGLYPTTPNPAPSVRRMPDLKHVMESPTPSH
jgi:hypothetical protein